jgi:hypothetical protein
MAQDKDEGNRIFSLKQVGAGTFLGGPLAAIYFLKKNCDALGQREKSRNIVMAGGFLTLCLIALLPFLPESFPNAAIPAGYTAGATAYARQLIPDAEGFGKFSGWRVFGVALLCIVLFLAMVIAFFMITDGLGFTDIAGEAPAP